jgi:hypothetical protein
MDLYQRHHFSRFSHHCRPITAGYFVTDSDGPSLPVLVPSRAKMLPVRTKQAIKVHITTGCSHHSTVSYHCRVEPPVPPDSDTRLYCRLEPPTAIVCAHYIKACARPLNICALLCLRTDRHARFFPLLHCCGCSSPESSMNLSFFKAPAWPPTSKVSDKHTQHSDCHDFVFGDDSYSWISPS